MIIRQIRPDELWQVMRTAAVCFEFPCDPEKYKDPESPEYRELWKKLCLPEPSDPELPSDHLPVRTAWGAFADDDQTMMAEMAVNNYTAHFDGAQVLLGGVCVVCCLPEYRRQRAIRFCFNAALQDMYREGFVFSCLYPFSRAYYRKFGYESGAYIRDYTIDLDAIRLPAPSGTVEQLMPGDDLSPLLEIYHEFCRDCNLSVIRKTYDASLSKENLLEQKRYIYLWKNGQGQPRGFVIARKTEDGIFDCTTTLSVPNAFFALDLQAYQGLLHFISTAFAADYRKIRLSVPDRIRLDSLVAEGNKISLSLSYNGMVRTINVRRALELCRCSGTGSLRIGVEDQQIPENTGVWKLEFAPGTENRVSLTEEPADVTMPVSSVGPLLCGICTADDLELMPEVKIINPDAPFDCVFRAKKCMMADHY